MKGSKQNEIKRVMLVLKLSYDKDKDVLKIKFRENLTTKDTSSKEEKEEMIIMYDKEGKILYCEIKNFSGREKSLNLEVDNREPTRQIELSYSPKEDYFTIRTDEAIASAAHEVDIHYYNDEGKSIGFDIESFIKRLLKGEDEIPIYV